MLETWISRLLSSKMTCLFEELISVSPFPGHLVTVNSNPSVRSAVSIQLSLFEVTGPLVELTEPMEPFREFPHLVFD